MVRLINQVQESLCNKYFMLTLNAGKVPQAGTMPDARPVAVPTLREVMEHRYNGRVVNEASPLGRPRIGAIATAAET